jgi:hypothetical protein
LTCGYFTNMVAPEICLEERAFMEEWRRGWRTVLGAALAAATGVNLLYFVFSLFIPHLQKKPAGRWASSPNCRRLSG